LRQQAQLVLRPEGAGRKTSDGLLVEFYIHAGAESEQTGRRGLALDLPEGSVLYTDAGYTDYLAEDLFNEASGSQQQSARRQNSKRPHHPAQCFLIQYFRMTSSHFLGRLKVEHQAF
jgi:hypothetical protein